MPTLKDPSLFRTEAYINGEWVKADSGMRFDVDNPADGSIVGSVPDCGAAETKRAIAAAEAALPGWRAKTAKERATILKRWFDLMMLNQDDLALILTTEQGKPLSEAKGEIAYGASFIEWFAEEGKRIYGDVIPPHMADKRLIVMKQPIGVTAAITPWNFPNAMITRKAGPALAAGCTMVLKPAEQTPFSALAMAELAARAGVPKGVLNIVTGASHSSPAIGQELCANPVVRKLSFTGSTEVGRILMRQSADTIKKLSLELGGNAPFIVFDDADLEAAADGLMMCKYRNAGQTCVTANRIYVQAGVYDAFAEKLKARMGKLKVGRGTDEGVSVGPLIDEAGLAKVEAHLQDAVAKGAKVEVGGKRHALGGRFFEPTVITNVPVSAKVSKEETFGPIAPLIKFDNEADAVARANDSEFGLASYFFARDVGRVFRVAEALESGMVAVNSGILSTEVAPFGGVKQSGLGREGSKYGIEEFLEMKYVCLGV
ncbi:MAG: NADP-dependent succinate-semialdehyde dehydrogenase [Betaproteobacteria bacterium]|nr:NADP-dependent succinate-semialdehyde dehydrogenase [Betaproteobacteria bacterium]